MNTVKFGRICPLALFVMLLTAIHPASYAQVNITNPTVFVTQVPNPFDFTTIGSTFGNHQNSPSSVPRGGDLWIRYPNGNLKNITAAAGYGEIGLQGSGAIAVRDPAVHWSGKKVIFSMIIGAPDQYDIDPFYWQLYEATDLGENETPAITKIANQPLDYNNISPVYGSDDHIIFTTDRPRDGQRHLYPQLDEYEEAPTVSGLWKLNPNNGALILLDHVPSGAFEPIVDSFGRIIYTRWDHLQRDQQAVTDDAAEAAGNPCVYCTYDWTDETPSATALTTRTEYFPEPWQAPAGSTENDYRINHFFPWMINQDGTEVETLNHIGRHELHAYFNRSFNNDANLNEFIDVISGRTNPNSILNFFQIEEDPQTAGRYIGTDAPEFQTHAAGQIVAMQAAPSNNPDDIIVEYLTHRDTANVSNNPSSNHSGLYRDPLPLSDGVLLAVHTSETRADTNTGTGNAIGSRYDFRIKTIVESAGVWAADQPMTTGISETVSYYNPDQLITYSGELWELQPVELIGRIKPPVTSEPALPTPEQNIVNTSDVNWAGFISYLEANNFAVIVSRDVTTRDNADVQQPFNLRVPNGTQTEDGGGTLYDVQYMQLFQGDLLRSIGNAAGRRPIARFMHDAPLIANNGPESSVEIASDGSAAAFVPAERALSWQLTAADGSPVVRERYWLTFQAGEVRVCASCHGLNDVDQAGNGTPINEPQALAALLDYWQNTICAETPTPTGCDAEVPLATTYQQQPISNSSQSRSFAHIGWMALGLVCLSLIPFMWQQSKQPF